MWYGHINKSLPESTDSSNHVHGIESMYLLTTYLSQTAFQAKSYPNAWLLAPLQDTVKDFDACGLSLSLATVCVPPYD